MFKMLKILCIVAFSFAPVTAWAQIDDARFQESLASLNRIKPLQSPAFINSGNLLKGNVIDQQNRIIGKVQDVVFNAGHGGVASVRVVFDGLRLSQEVDLGYGDVKMNLATNGYRLDMKSDEVAALYPSLLSGIETAAGDGELSALSVKAMTAKPVIIAGEGRRIGEIGDVLFDRKGAKVQGFYVLVNSGVLRNVGVAVPVSAFTVTSHHDRIQAELPRAQADLLLEFARQRK